MHSCGAVGLERWDLIFQAFFRCFVSCVSMHACSAGNIARWDLILETLINYFMHVSLLFLRRREPWKMGSHLPRFISMSCGVGVDAYLRERAPWKMTSHLLSFLLMLHIVCFDAFLRCLGPCKNRCHLPSFLSMLKRVCFDASCTAGSFDRRDLIFHVYLCFICCVLTHACATGRLEV